MFFLVHFDTVRVKSAGYHLKLRGGMLKNEKEIRSTYLSSRASRCRRLAQAGTTYGEYDVIVPKLNGNAFTPQQTKSTTGASADLKVSILGKPLDARAHSYSGGTGPWVRIATVGGPFKLPNSIKSGKDARVEFSSDFT
ncbi:hypothetical protein PTHTG4_34460 [Parageobacillus thermoglucosidasius]|uniref:Uncharacterized protein n=2 Tax=Anoxybacillaceae TaxID=3120669 RepID=A0A7U3YI86_GEOS0|nr:hypothetical protein PTHTG4_34460 [Parageobacillus thermoglucosidasius]